MKKFVVIFCIALFSITSCSEDVIQMDSKQLTFIDVIASHARKYEEAKNEIQKTKLRISRREAFEDFFGEELIFAGWVGELERLSTSAEGHIDYLAIEVSDSIDLRVKNSIKIDDPIYRTLETLEEGVKIVFSGRFVSQSKNYIEEISFTEKGGMVEPTFQFIITDVRRYTSFVDIEDSIAENDYGLLPANLTSRHDLIPVDYTGAYHFEGNKFYFEGKTNLPSGTKIGISLEDEDSNYHAQDIDILVNDDNTFKSGGFTNRGEKVKGDLKLSIFVYNNKFWQTAAIRKKLEKFALTEDLNGIVPTREHEESIMLNIKQ